MISELYAPTTSIPLQSSSRQNFSEIPTKELKVLYSDALTTRALAVLSAVGALCTFGASIITLSHPEVGNVVLLLAIGALSICTSVGLFMKKPWGRILGLLQCGIACVSGVLGILIGGLGFIALFRSKKLFEDRDFRVSYLAKEVKHRKKNKID